MGVVPLNRAELAAEVSIKTGLSVHDAAAAVNAVFEAVEESVCRGEKVNVRGFGSFEAKVKKARMARNPVTKEEIKIGETIVPVFKAGDRFKKSVLEKNKER